MVKQVKDVYGTCDVAKNCLQNENRQVHIAKIANYLQLFAVPSAQATNIHIQILLNFTRNCKIATRSKIKIKSGVWHNNNLGALILIKTRSSFQWSIGESALYLRRPKLREGSISAQTS